MKYLALAVCFSGVAACGKAASKQSLDAQEMKLLHDLPGGNLGLLGGDLLRLQDFMSTLAGQLATKSGAPISADLDAHRAFADCLSGKGSIQALAGVAVSSGLEVRMVLADKTIETIATCAAKAQYPVTEDPDHKFIVLTVTLLGKPVWTANYLQLADGNLMTDFALENGAFAPKKRADLEALVATLPKSSAADDKHPIELAAKADRTKTFWFAGSDAKGDIYGAFNIAADALSVDATMNLASAALATELEGHFQKLREMSAGAPPPMKTLVANTHVDRSNATIHVTSSVTTEQLEDLVMLLELQH